MATKKEITVNEYNDNIWKEIALLESQIEKLKEALKPAVLPKQASLNECNALARKAKTAPVNVDAKKVSAERGL